MVLTVSGKFLPLMITNAFDDKRCRSTATESNSATGFMWRTIAAEFWRFSSGAESAKFIIWRNRCGRNLTIVRKVLALIGKPESLLTPVKDRPGHDRRYALRCEKMEKELGWKPEIPWMKVCGGPSSGTGQTQSGWPACGAGNIFPTTKILRKSGFLSACAHLLGEQNSQMKRPDSI